jgi:hypothetical protein
MPVFHATPVCCGAPCRTPCRKAACQVKTRLIAASWRDSLPRPLTPPRSRAFCMPPSLEDTPKCRVVLWKTLPNAVSSFGRHPQGLFQGPRHAKGATQVACSWEHRQPSPALLWGQGLRVGICGRSHVHAPETNGRNGRNGCAGKAWSSPSLLLLLLLLLLVSGHRWGGESCLP